MSDPELSAKKADDLIRYHKQLEDCLESIYRCSPAVYSLLRTILHSRPSKKQFEEMVES